jgi:hypothetical protein
MFNIRMVYGRGNFNCKWQTPQDRFVDNISPAKTGGLESMMRQVSEKTGLPTETNTFIRENELMYLISVAKVNR